MHSPSNRNQRTYRPEMTSDDHRSANGQGSISVSVAAPAYNEADGIKQTLDEWLQFLQGAPWVANYEIVIADDGSTDDTARVVSSLDVNGDFVKLVSLDRNRGAGVALRAAIRATEMDWVLLLDSDGQFAIEDSTLLYDELIRTGADIVVGSRRTKKEDRLLLRLGSRASAALSASAAKRADLDLNSALKLGRGEVMRALNLEARHLNYSSDVTLKGLEAGAVVVGVSVGHRSRESGKSSAAPLRDGFARIIFTAYSLLRAFAIRHGILDVEE